MDTSISAIIKDFDRLYAKEKDGLYYSNSGSLDAFLDFADNYSSKLEFHQETKDIYKGYFQKYAKGLYERDFEPLVLNSNIKYSVMMSRARDLLGAGALGFFCRSGIRISYDKESDCRLDLFSNRSTRHGIYRSKKPY